MNEAVARQARRVQVEAQIIKKQSKTDRRSAALQALLQACAELQDELEEHGKECSSRKKCYVMRSGM